MMEKIEWYQEVLKLDPDSKVFFPLAKLLRDSQQPDKAIEVLRAGLQHSSVFFSAPPADPNSFRTVACR